MQEREVLTALAIACMPVIIGELGAIYRDMKADTKRIEDLE